LINQLQDIFTVTGGAVASGGQASSQSESVQQLVLELPQIVVVGSQV
jgi:methylmalonyl-CoA mutase cobalamin-binding subunit